VKLGHVALDGTKIKANAGINKAMSYGRMKEAEPRLAGGPALAGSGCQTDKAEIVSSEPRSVRRDARVDGQQGEAA